MVPKESKLAEMLNGYSFVIDELGESSAKVYRCHKNDETFYLKIAAADKTFKCEYQMLTWLDGKLPVPKIKYWHEQDGLAYLLMTEAPGKLALDYPKDKLRKPYKNTIKAMAEGLLILQSIDIKNCPFHYPLDTKLANMLYNIENNLVDMDEWYERTGFETPMDLYSWLISNKPSEEICFAHDDYTPENIFTDNNKLACIIDVGDCGLADKWKDIALCVRSIKIHLGNMEQEDVNKHVALLFDYLGVEPDWNKHVALLFDYLGVEPDWIKIKYYTLLDELC